jgi:hypothetical protein
MISQFIILMPPLAISPWPSQVFTQGISDCGIADCRFAPAP